MALLKVGQIVIVDLDTIDVSNLNRQFLFRPEHVGKPKAEVACEAARRLNPDMKVSFLCENVKNFDHSFLVNFDIVMSALDNVDARRHLNRICLTAGKPLIEAGSTGYIGQSRVIVKGVTECYDCQKKEAPKVFPVCTIRSAPSTPLHCIQWAKLLYELLFGTADESSIIKDQHIRSDDPLDYLRRLFHDDIQSLASLKDKWVHRQAPIPVDLSQVPADQGTKLIAILRSKSQEVLPISEYMIMFLSAVEEVLRHRRDLIGKLSFSKDDPVSVDFVAAASNLRMFNYHIPLKSRWDIESIAGSIVPAIASTNAIVAGLQSFNLSCAMKGSTGRDLWVRYPQPSGNGSIVQSSNPPGPNRDCFICQNTMITVGVRGYGDCSLADLVDLVFKQELSINCPVLIKDGNLIYDDLEDDEEVRQNYGQSLIFWDFVTAGQQVQVEDGVTNQTYHVSISEVAILPNGGSFSINGDTVGIVTKRVKLSD